MSQQTLQNKVLFRRTLKTIWVGLFVVLWTVASVSVSPPPTAQAATSSTINFQARLLHANGSLVADGFYNVQFKLYTVASGGTEIWTESYYDSNGLTAGNDNRARVVNGYLSVNLGSQTAFGSSIDWDQEHWLTMNVGGTEQTATPTYDGEMDPRLKLTAVPYAFTAGQLSKTTGANTSTLGWDTQTAANSILLPDDSGTICLQNDASCGFLTGSAGDYIQNGTSPQTADLNITGDATVGSLLTSTVDRATSGTLTIGGTTATAITLADDTTVAAGKTLILAGGNTASRPGTTEGSLYYDTTTDQLLVYANGKWQADSKTATFIVAASNSSQSAKDGAQYVADGTDDQVEISAAIAAIASTGGVVYLSEGTFNLTANIVLDKTRTTILGSGRSTILKRYFDSGSSSGLVNLAIDDAVISSLSIDGTKATYTSSNNHGIRFTAGQRQTVSGVWITNVAGSGITTAGGTGNNAHIIDNDISGSTVRGISTDNPQQIMISRNRVYSNTDAGIYIGNSSTPAIISGNWTYSNGGVGIRGGTTVTNNVIYSNGGGGISAVSNATISSNTISSNTGTGIGVSEGVNDINITSNHISNGTTYGISVDASSGIRVNIADNYVFQNAYHGIRLSNNPNYASVSNNRIHNNGGTGSYSGIAINAYSGSSHKIFVMNNVISDTAGTGYAIDITNGDQIYVSENVFYGTGAASIRDAGTNTIYANQIDENGVLMNRSAGGFTIQNTDGEGILTADESAGSVILGQSSALSGTLAFANATNANTVTITSGTTSTSYTLTLPTALGSTGDCLKDTNGSGVLGFGSCGVASIGTIDSETKSANGAVISGTEIILQTADPDYAGLVSTGTQSFAGAKTFNNTVTIAANQALALSGGATGSRPGSPSEGMVFYDTTTKQLLTYSNGKWQSDSKTATVIVAASNSSQSAKDGAQYVADGTNDESEINSAISALPANGGSVVLLEGTYNFGVALTVSKANVSILGVGENTVLLRNYNEGSSSGMIVVTEAKVQLSQMTLNGNNASYSSTNNGAIRFNNSGASYGKISNVTALNFAGRTFTINEGGSGSHGVIEKSRISVPANGVGIFVNNSQKVVITGNKLTGAGSGQGFYTNGSSSNAIVSNNYIDGFSGSDIGSSMVFEGNIVVNSGTYGIRAPAGNVTVSNNQFINSNNAIQPEWGAGACMSSSTITGNHFSGNSIGITTGVYNTLISGNTFTGNTRGISFSGSCTTTGVISNNTFIENGGSGTTPAIELGNSSNVSITGNRISDNSGTGSAIKLTAGASTTYLSDNTYSGTGASNIDDAGTGTIYANQLDENGVLLNRSSGGFTIDMDADITGDLDVDSGLLFVDSSANSVSVAGTMDVQTNSASAFVVQNNSSDALFTVDTSNNRIELGAVSGTPTLLVLGDKTTAGDPSGTDGAMYYNSALGSFRCYQNGGWQNCVSPSYEVLDIQDEFMSGMEASTALESTNSAGQLGWFCMNQSGTDACELNWNDEDAGHPGIVYVGSMTTTSGNAGRMNLRPIDTGDFDRMTFIVKTATSTYHSNSYYQIGLLEDGTAISDSTPSSGAFFRYTGGNWTAVTRLSDTETTTDTGVSNATYTWYRLEIVRNGSNNFEFYINGTLEATHTTNKPTGSQVPAVRVQNAGSNFSEIHVDYFSMRSRVLSR